LQIGFDIVKQKNLSSLQRLIEKGFVYTERDMFCQNIPANHFYMTAKILQSYILCYGFVVHL